MTPFENFSPTIYLVERKDESEELNLLTSQKEFKFDIERERKQIRRRKISCFFKLFNEAKTLWLFEKLIS
jgi:hypothetical protein